VGVDPLALDQLLEQRAVKTAGASVIDILDARLLAQFGGAQPRREALVLPVGGIISFWWATSSGISTLVGYVRFTSTPAVCARATTEAPAG
jgi:hypothetical protein